jgi:hypothetical protein
MARRHRWTEDDYRPSFGGEHFGGEGGPVDWLHPGGTRGFAGLGPRNYIRTDESILEDINEKLTHHPMIDATDIEVTSFNGSVKMHGRVDNPYMKLMAEVVAWSVSGVKDVQNEISIMPNTEGERAA